MAINALTDMLGQVVRIRHSITLLFPFATFANANPFSRHIVALEIPGLNNFCLLKNIDKKVESKRIKCTEFA